MHGAAARLAAIRSMRPVAPAAVRPNLADAMFKRPGLPEGSPLAREQAPTTPYPTRSPAPAPDPAPAETGAAGMDALAAVINANIRLPQRRPGTAPQPEPLTPVLPRNQEPAPEATAEDPSAAAEDQPTVEQPTVEQPTVEQAAEEQVIEQEQPEDSPLLEPDAPAEVPETLDTEVLATVTALRGSDALDDPLSSSASYALDEHSDDDETPMFRMLRSGWFTNDADDQGWGPGEADEGWQAADRISDAAPSRLTRSGLPVRDPGNRLVPGGMAQPAPTLHRDPEAIRARLSAHAAGVARGRTMATAAAHDQSTDPAEDVTPR